MPTTRELPTASLSLHPEAAKVPEMPKEQYERFLADVKAHGIQKPIEVIPGTRTVIDGRTRLKAATDAGLAAVPVVDADLAGDTDVIYMMRVALHRRHLTKDQAAMLAVEIEKQLAHAAKERQREGGRKGGRGRPAEQVVADLPQPNPTPVAKSREAAAAIAGVSPRAVSDAKKVAKEAPELAEKVKAGEVKLSAAVAEVKAKEAPKPAPAAKPAPPASHAAKAGPQLSPCPFCGLADTTLIFGTSYLAKCKSCNAIGPRLHDGASMEQATAAWNKRVAHNSEAELAAKMKLVAKAEEERAAAIQAAPKPIPTKPLGTLPLREVPAFPAELVKHFAKAKLVTLFDVQKRVEAEKGTEMKQSLCDVFASVPGRLDKLKVRQAADAVLGFVGHMHSTPANWEKAEAKRKGVKPYGYCITYTRNDNGKEERCHFVGTESAARRKAKFRPHAKTIISVEGLTEQQYVRAYGRGRS